MIYCQYLMKVGRRKKKKIEKYFISFCLRELKMRKLTFYHYHSCHLQKIKVEEQYLVHMNGIMTISPTSSE